MDKEREPLITSQEREYILDKLPRRSFYVFGLLSAMRRQEVSLSEIWQQAVSVPGNEEHVQAFTEAYEFLNDNAEFFSQDRSGS